MQKAAEWMHFSLYPGRYHKRSERNSRGSSTRISFKDIKLGTSSKRKVFWGRASAVKPYWIFAKEWQEKDYRDKPQQQMFSVSREVCTPCFSWWGWIRRNHFCRQIFGLSQTALSCQYMNRLDHGCKWVPLHSAKHSTTLKQLCKKLHKVCVPFPCFYWF